MAFRLTAKSFFLTYPQCTLTKEEAIAQLKVLGPTTYWVIGREKHEDGNPHLHAVVTFTYKRNVKSVNFFDLKGENTTYHGNYQTCKNVDASINYCKKDGDWIESDEIEDADESLIEIARKHSREEFLEVCLKRKIPYGYFEEAWKITHANNSMTVEEDSQGKEYPNEA